MFQFNLMKLLLFSWSVRRSAQKNEEMQKNYTLWNSRNFHVDRAVVHRSVRRSPGRSVGRLVGRSTTAAADSETAAVAAAAAASRSYSFFSVCVVCVCFLVFYVFSVGQALLSMTLLLCRGASTSGWRK